MTREHQLKFCKICKNQKFDMHQGIICGLTNQPADFQDTCIHFAEDPELLPSPFEELEKELDQREASKNKRFANYVIDYFGYLLFSTIIGFMIGIIMALVNPDSLLVFEEENLLLDYGLSISLYLIYYIGFEAATGKTLGKLITKTKVVDENGEKPDLKTIFLRSVSRLVPFEAFSFLGSDSVGWHDSWSKTRVIEA